MSAATRIRWLMSRARKAQMKRDCPGAYYTMVQAVRAYGDAVGSESLGPGEVGPISKELRQLVDDVFEGCIGEER